MRTVKLTQSMMRDPATLMRKIQAVRTLHERAQAYPTHVYMSPKDYKKLRKNLRKELKKEYSYLNNQRLSFAVNMNMLDLGPVVSKGVKEGYVLVDDSGIDQESSRA